MSIKVIANKQAAAECFLRKLLPVVNGKNTLKESYLPWSIHTQLKTVLWYTINGLTATPYAL